MKTQNVIRSLSRIGIAILTSAMFSSCGIQEEVKNEIRELEAQKEMIEGFQHQLFGMAMSPDTASEKQTVQLQECASTTLNESVIGTLTDPFAGYSQVVKEQVYLHYRADNMDEGKRIGEFMAFQDVSPRADGHKEFGKIYLVFRNDTGTDAFLKLRVRFQSSYLDMNWTSEYSIRMKAGEKVDLGTAGIKQDITLGKFQVDVLEYAGIVTEPELTTVIF